ncbi:conserved hypothetical protein [Culex quinquefasciatus]|uniref:Uncharacterized protein n=1 Tax=Culex quinquefasciatus TaxID=7176 RepID=B0WLW4_CULQU|nr:conserved hypothetical protein [Culex quinquefasciatus]|eukprot:XP_001849698.1 conserved hypothetical protein [Culex quinquefasciatus]
MMYRPIYRCFPLFLAVKHLETSVDGDGQTLKRSREDLTVADYPDEVENITDLWRNMKKLLFNSNSRLEGKIDACKTSIDDLEEEFVALRKECGEQMEAVHHRVNSVEFGLQQTAEDVARLERASELIISGIPYQQTENLPQFFQNIATVLGYDQPPIVDLQRLAKLPIAAGSAPPILCQFALRNVRNDFYRRYMTNRDLTLRHIGFDADKRIFMNENLTKLAREIRSQALRMKKAGIFAQVFTRNGAVYVKRQGQPTSELVQCVQQLSLQK